MSSILHTKHVLSSSQTPYGQVWLVESKTTSLRHPPFPLTLTSLCHIVPDHAAVLQRGRFGAVHHGLGLLLWRFLPWVTGKTEQRSHPLRLHIQDGVCVPHLLQVSEGGQNTNQVREFICSNNCTTSLHTVYFHTGGVLLVTCYGTDPHIVNT